MKDLKKEISKEVYDRAMANHGFLKPEDYKKVFSISELMGYGVYNETVIKQDEKYYVRYQIGDSCD